jgi:1,4-alpha-glucan branching enzyme
VCALDTELLGHWWHEGPWWLDAVLEEAGAQGLALTSLDDALERHEAVPAPPELPVTSWGSPRDLSTWSGPGVADLAWRARAAELRVLAAGAPGPRALRELLALQASDWAFMVTRELAGPYPRERSDGHFGALDEALRLGSAAQPALRNLAPTLAAAALPEL